MTKTQNGQSRVVSNEEIQGDTFGGNIGELYLNAFFLDGSLVSQFAAAKINELLDKLFNSKLHLSEEDEKLISQLGDDVIRFQINNLRNG